MIHDDFAQASRLDLDTLTHILSLSFSDADPIIFIQSVVGMTDSYLSASYGALYRADKQRRRSKMAVPAWEERLFGPNVGFSRLNHVRLYYIHINFGKWRR